MAYRPVAYQQEYVRARAFDQAAADNWIRHTTIGDPVLDSMMEGHSSVPPPDLHLFIRAGIEPRHELLRDAPRIRRDFFDNLEGPPWLDYEAFRPGIHAFHRNADLIPEYS